MNVEQLLHEAIEAFNNNEMIDGEVCLFSIVVKYSILFSNRWMIPMRINRAKSIMMIYRFLMEIQRSIKLVRLIFKYFL